MALTLTNEHTLSAIKVCGHEDGSLRGIQLQVAIYSAGEFQDFRIMSKFGDMDIKDGNCSTDFVDTAAPIVSATVFYNSTQVVSLWTVNSAGEQKRYGNASTAKESRTTTFPKMDLIGLLGQENARGVYSLGFIARDRKFKAE